jgi:hypothetical protein
MGGSFMKRSRTRAYANIRTGGLLAIERKFSDMAYPESVLASSSSGVVVDGTHVSTYSPPVVGPTLYRSATGLMAAVAPVALNVLGPGDTGSDRDGRQVINDSIHIRGSVGYVNNNYVTSSADCVVNICLVLDTQTNGTGPTGAAVFVNPGDGSGFSPIANGSAPFVNLSNSKRFRILKHIRRSLNPSAISGNAVATYASGGFAFAMDVPLKQMKTNYVSDTALIPTAGGSATVASIGDNGLFLFAWTDTSGIVLSYNMRLRFRG